MNFICNTEDDIRQMLSAIGVTGINDLFVDIPDSILLREDLKLPKAMSEIEISRHMESLGGQNRDAVSFIGAGSYNHYIPAAVDALSSRSEFYTAYTPYQAEVSQGTLTAIFEFQTMLCRLTGMDVANASMYDGATSLAEAVLMSLRTSGRKSVVIGRTLHPHYRQVLQTYCWANDCEIRDSGMYDGVMDSDRISALLDENVSAVVIQSPNFFGCIENVSEIAEIARRAGAHNIVVVAEPLSLGILKRPGDLGADIVCGEARSFGNPTGFGGPALGMLAAKKEFTRKMPGRLVGRTVDLDGADAFTLTLQTREQHIRRERATSNICTNQGLCALRAVIYLSLIGNGMRDLAELNHRIAALCRKKLADIGYETVYNRPYFNEFVVRIHNSSDVLQKLKGEGFLAGLDCSLYYEDMKDCILICATEVITPEDIDRLVSVMELV